MSNFLLITIIVTYSVNICFIINQNLHLFANNNKNTAVKRSYYFLLNQLFRLHVISVYLFFVFSSLFTFNVCFNLSPGNFVCSFFLLYFLIFTLAKKNVPHSLKYDSLVVHLKDHFSPPQKAQNDFSQRNYSVKKLLTLKVLSNFWASLAYIIVT